MSSPGSAARERRIRLMRSKQAEAFRDRLSAFRTYEFVQWSEFPDWLVDEWAKTRRTSAEPDDVLPERAADAEIKAWLTRFVAEAGLGERFYLLSGIEEFPWLDCAVAGDNWLDNLVEVKGYGWTAISHAKDTLVVFYEEEHEYQAFLVAPAHLRDENGVLV